MQKLNLWNKHTLHRYQIIAGGLLILLTAAMLPKSSSAQHTYNQPFYDYSRNMHFGFTLGSNFSRFHYEFSDDFYQNDTLLQVNNRSFPGLTLGAIANWHTTERFNLRFLPSLILNQRNLEYEFADGTVEEREVESVLIEFPVHGKYKASRHGDFRFYILGGGKYSYDIASQAEAASDPQRPIVALEPHQFSFEFGMGIDLYFKYFKFSPEIKISHGINDVLAESPSMYTQVFDRIRTRFVYINLHFEG